MNNAELIIANLIYLLLSGKLGCQNLQLIARYSVVFATHLVDPWSLRGGLEGNAQQSPCDLLHQLSNYTYLEQVLDKMKKIRIDSAKAL